MRACVHEHSWDAAAETIRRSLEAVLAAPGASRTTPASTPAGAAEARVAALGGSAGVEGSVGRPDRDGHTLRKVASAG